MWTTPPMSLDAARERAAIQGMRPGAATRRAEGSPRTSATQGLTSTPGTAPARLPAGCTRTQARTASAEPAGQPAQGSPDGTRRWRALLRKEWPLAVFCACVAAIALLYNLFGAPDVLYDEAAYAYGQAGRSAGATEPDKPAHVLHPPLMWLLEAGWLRLTGYASAPEPSAIYAARLLSASVGAIAVILIAAMAYRLAGSASSRQREADHWRGHATRRARPRPRAL